MQWLHLKWHYTVKTLKTTQCWVNSGKSTLWVIFDPASWVTQLCCAMIHRVSSEDQRFGLVGVWLSDYCFWLPMRVNVIPVHLIFCIAFLTGQLNKTATFLQLHFYSNTVLKYIPILKNEILSKQLDQPQLIPIVAEHLPRCQSFNFITIYTKRGHLRNNAVL